MFIIGSIFLGNDDNLFHRCSSGVLQGAGYLRPVSASPLACRYNLLLRNPRAACNNAGHCRRLLNGTVSITVFLLPYFTFPFLEVCQTVHPKEGDRTVVFVPIVR